MEQPYPKSENLVLHLPKILDALSISSLFWDEQY